MRHNARTSRGGRGRTGPRRRLSRTIALICVTPAALIAGSWAAVAEGVPATPQDLPAPPITRADITDRAFVLAKTAQAPIAGQQLAAARLAARLAVAAGGWRRAVAVAAGSWRRAVAAPLAAGEGSLRLAFRERQDLEAAVAGLGTRLDAFSGANTAAAEAWRGSPRYRKAPMTTRQRCAPPVG